MPDPIDLLQIKIDKAKAALPEATRRAIETSNWKDVIVKMRETHGYTYEQLGDLELETELLLAGLVPTDKYPKELEARMKISPAQAQELVNEMNQLVFSKIREEFVKITETPRPVSSPPAKGEWSPRATEGVKKTEPSLPEVGMPEIEGKILKQAGIEITPKGPVPNMKLTDTFQMPKKTTEYTLPGISKTPEAAGKVDEPPKKYSGLDPYREKPQ